MTAPVQRGCDAFINGEFGGNWLVELFAPNRARPTLFGSLGIALQGRKVFLTARRDPRPQEPPVRAASAAGDAAPWARPSPSPTEPAARRP